MTMNNISTNGGLSSTKIFYKNNHIDYIYARVTFVKDLLPL